MTRVVGVIAQGAMGAGFGARFVEHGVKVLTVVEGRSVASRERAVAAGMTPVTWEEIVDVDLFISLVPPGEALALAQKLSPWFKASRRKAVYADLNAISPNTAVAVGEIVTEAGLQFADGGICGEAPRPDGHSPAIYTSGPGARAFGVNRDFGLDIRVMDAPIGAASAIKICQSGFTKGYTAMTSIVVLAAMRFGAGETLRAELMASRPGLYDFVAAATLRMFDKAYRYGGEMEEIADFLDKEIGGKEVFGAFREVYDHLATDRAEGNRDIDLLREFYTGADATRAKAT
jgi:L-threonate 2-dehydrogenase